MYRYHRAWCHSAYGGAVFLFSLASVGVTVFNNSFASVGYSFAVSRFKGLGPVGEGRVFVENTAISCPQFSHRFILLFVIMVCVL